LVIIDIQTMDVVLRGANGAMVDSPSAVRGGFGNVQV